MTDPNDTPDDDELAAAKARRDAAKAKYDEEVAAALADRPITPVDLTIHRLGVFLDEVIEDGPAAVAEAMSGYIRDGWNVWALDYALYLAVFSWASHPTADVVADAPAYIAEVFEHFAGINERLAGMTERLDRMLAADDDGDAAAATENA